MLDLARSNQIQYDFDDLKALLNLQCGIDQSGKDGTAAQNGGTPLLGSDATMSQTNQGDKARRQYNEYLIVRLRFAPPPPSRVDAVEGWPATDWILLAGALLARSDGR